MTRTERDPLFRKKMFALMALLLVGYIGLKSWHVSLAITAYQGQTLSGEIRGAAK